jgi:hypothetical protein
MKPALLVVLAGIALASLQDAVTAQTLTNPGGFRGVPTVPGSVGGFTNPVGGGPRLRTPDFGENVMVPFQPEGAPSRV